MTKVIVVGATGFIGRALCPELVRAGYRVRACSRRPPEDASPGGVEWIRCDVSRPESLGPALHGVDAAYYLVHGLGSADFRARDRRAAGERGDGGSRDHSQAALLTASRRAA